MVIPWPKSTDDAAGQQRHGLSRLLADTPIKELFCAVPRTASGRVAIDNAERRHTIICRKRVLRTRENVLTHAGVQALACDVGRTLCTSVRGRHCVQRVQLLAEESGKAGTCMFRCSGYRRLFKRSESRYTTSLGTANPADLVTKHSAPVMHECLRRSGVRLGQWQSVIAPQAAVCSSCA